MHDAKGRTTRHEREADRGKTWKRNLQSRVDSTVEGDQQPVWLIVSPWSVVPSSGVNHVIRELARHLPACSRYRSLLLINDWACRSPEYSEADADMIGAAAWRMRLYNPATGTRLRGLIGYFLWSIRGLPRLWSMLRRCNVSVVNVHYPSLSVLSFVILRYLPGTRFSVLLSFHGTDFGTIVAMTGSPRLLWRVVLSRADGVVGCSMALAQAIVELAPGMRNKVTGIPNGVDGVLFSRERVGKQRLRRMPSDPVRLLCVGTYAAHKGHDVLLEALAILKAASPSPIRLTIAGARGATFDATEVLIERLGLRGIVDLRLSRPHSEVVDLMANADIFVLPSLREAFGLVVVEAGAMGLPVIASRVGGVPEIIDDGVHGRLVEPGDSKALANAIRGMIEHPSQAAEYGAALQDRVRHQFTWRKMAERYVEFIDGLDEGSSQRQKP